MSGPFSNSDAGDAFTANRCDRCIHRDPDTGDPCDEFTPAYLGEWPEILISADTPVGVECTRFEPGEPLGKLTVAPELGSCWLPVARRWRAVKALDVLRSAGQLGQVEWINHGSGWRSAGRPQAKVVGHPPFFIDPDAEVEVLVPTIERDALAVVRAGDPNAYGIDCTGHAHAGDEKGAA